MFVRCSSPAGAHTMTFSRLLWLSASLLLVLCGNANACSEEAYEIDGKCCPNCDPGSRVKKDCTESAGTSCQLCAEMTFVNQRNGRKNCFPCSNCDAGKFHGNFCFKSAPLILSVLNPEKRNSEENLCVCVCVCVRVCVCVCNLSTDSGLKVNTPCTATSDTACGPLVGFFCSDSDPDGCKAAQKHKRCSPGEYTRGRGTPEKDTECSDCEAGTFSNGTSCQPHTNCEELHRRMLKRGTASEDAACGEVERTSAKAIMGIVVFFVFIAVSTIAYLKMTNDSCRSSII